MSKYYGLYCATRNVSTDSWINWGGDQLREYLRVSKFLRGAGIVLNYINLTLIDHDWIMGELIEFLDTHKDHEIKLHTEYGDIENLEAEAT